MASSDTNNPSSPPFTPPNPIPPRRSSTGLSRNSVQRAVAETLTSPQTYQSFAQPTPLPGVLGPVVETDIFGQQKEQVPQKDRQRAQKNPTVPLAVAIMHQQQQQPLSQAPDPSRYEHEDLDFTPKRSWTDDKEKVVRAPFDYVASHPGKDFRSQVINSFNAFLQVPPERLNIITKAVGMLHESSLLIDDVQDSSELRRGFPVAHHIFGVPQTINSANYIYFAALQELQKLNNPAVISMFSDELVNLHRGQGMDLFWRDTLTCPSEDDYLEMVGNKTGGLFRLGIKLMQAESASGTDCIPLVNLVGLIFQIRDDYMNLSSKEYSNNKGLCEDLTEGKFSFPVIHSIRTNPGNMQLINILKQKTADVQVKRYAVAYMESTGSFEYTESVIAILIARARRMAQDMDGGDGKSSGVQKILDKMVIQAKSS
ncbi:uncharacterized protein UV8b_07497 [Ustilaginoidea virens]|uniref:Uncharacterized protein n=1 Tax=Ustilaginoidea virens TaxID=1159556 RepID=A0A1B5KWJ0_USTVR|nr:uncharacterized protein UV8b_07497 [Ustilaginoidea virens]QUC23256.1 hypothetical protein UV8b_07497 [Ustilaginoidea virens]GAO14335.1 hypothetical protein UVI_02034100 [Ustilaginoidea virens]